MPLWQVAILAFGAMCADDIAATVMVIFESRLNAPLAGAFDVLGWFFSLICSALAIESIIRTGWWTRRSLTIIAAVSMANFAGTFAGVWIGAALTHR